VRSTRDIRNKIRTVRNIEQICRAMKTVSSIRLRRAEQRLLRSRPFHAKLTELVHRVAGVTESHPYLEEREVRTTGLVLVTSDRGLCGGYNAVVTRAALALGTPADTAAIAIGRKGQVQLRLHGYRIIDEMGLHSGEVETQSVQLLADRLGERFLRGEIDRLLITYSRFLGGTRSEIVRRLVLPIRQELAAPADVIFEPTAREMLPNLLQRYLRSELLAAVLEATASEHAARVAAMSAASDNAVEMIQQLTRDYNKARQAAITKELIEIVSAAESAA
jgi:F-type H+-transporting ATPase subunit gamma